MKPFIKQLGLYLLVVFLSPPAIGWSQSTSPRERLAQNDKQTLERWQRMTPEEKQEVRERFQRWKNMPPAEKEELQKKFENWRRMPPEEKATAQRNFERWQKLTPEQRERLQVGNSGASSPRNGVRNFSAVYKH